MIETDSCSAHGTHCASVAAGHAFGVAKKATIVSVQVLGCDGIGLVSGVIDGLQWAVLDLAQHGGKGVAVMSLNGKFNSVLNDAVNNAVSHGLITVTAAGNEARDACVTSPASASDAIAVGATTATVPHASVPPIPICTPTILTRCLAAPCPCLRDVCRTIERGFLTTVSVWTSLLLVGRCVILAHTICAFMCTTLGGGDTRVCVQVLRF